jgi:DNA-binding NarL/FixJ family response regulator
VIDILVVSDIKIYCEGLHRIFAGVEAVNVVGAVSCREVALALTREQRPHVVLLDMTMTRSCELARLLVAAGGHTKVVALAVPHDDQDILRCAEAGITAYVLRESSTEELVEAVKQAAEGGCYCPPRIAACILRKIEAQASAVSERRAPYEATAEAASPMPLPGSLRLTPREQQIMPLLAEGHTNKEIARGLCIEVSTVKNHVHNILLKLEVRSRSQAIPLLQKLLQQPQLSYGSLDLDPSRPTTSL